jgi:hypothetical protein
MPGFLDQIKVMLASRRVYPIDRGRNVFGRIVFADLVAIGNPAGAMLAGEQVKTEAGAVTLHPPDAPRRAYGCARGAAQGGSQTLSLRARRMVTKGVMVAY